MAATWVVTGANRGLGLEYARQLQGRGETVLATARRPREADELNALGAQVHPLDVGDDDSVAEFDCWMADRPVDVLVNNAGVGVDEPGLEELEMAELVRFFQVNTLGALRVSRALLPNLRAARTRRIVNITSRMGSIGDNSSGGAYAYRASKAALNMVTRSMAVDLRPEGFTCVVLHPGWVRTAMGGSRAPLTPTESVRGMLAVIDGLSVEDSGGFFDYQGRTVPW